jgi:hypothetical protein
MKIVYITSCSGTAGSFPAGSVRDLPEAKALYLISIGRAEMYVEDNPKETLKNEVSNLQPTSGRANKSKRGKRPSKN